MPCHRHGFDCSPHTLDSLCVSHQKDDTKLIASNKSEGKKKRESSATEKNNPNNRKISPTRPGDLNSSSCVVSAQWYSFLLISKWFDKFPPHPRFQFFTNKTIPVRHCLPIHIVDGLTMCFESYTEGKKVAAKWHSHLFRSQSALIIQLGSREAWYRLIKPFISLSARDFSFSLDAHRVETVKLDAIRVETRWMSTMKSFSICLDSDSGSAFWLIIEIKILFTCELRVYLNHQTKAGEAFEKKTKALSVRWCLDDPRWNNQRGNAITLNVIVNLLLKSWIKWVSVGKVIQMKFISEYKSLFNEFTRKCRNVFTRRGDSTEVLYWKLCLLVSPRFANMFASLPPPIHFSNAKATVAVH